MNFSPREARTSDDEESTEGIFCKPAWNARRNPPVLELMTSRRDIVGATEGRIVVTNAVRLAPLLNCYLLQAGPPKTIVIPQAPQLAKIQEIAFRGTLLKNQVVTWDPRVMKRRVAIGKRGGQYALQEDGSLEFCIGVKPL